MVIYRKMVEEDIDQVDLLEHTSFSQPWPRHALLEIITKDEMDYYVATDSVTGKILGGCAMFLVLGEGDISNVAVFPEYRNQGIATGLLQYAIEDGRNRGLTEFTLEVRVSNAPAIHAYEKIGFISEGIRPNFYSQPKEDAMVMWIREKK